MARVKDAEPRNSDETNLIAQAKQYAFLKGQLDYLEKQQKELRAKLFEVIDTNGEVDSKGNIILELPEEVDGFFSVMKQRRVTRKINELRAEEIIEEKGLEETLYKTIRVIDEDALMAALYSDELTEEEIEEMYPQNVVWALVMSKK
jgi:uncharacterized protein YebE (UPF0316 family)